MNKNTDLYRTYMQYKDCRVLNGLATKLRYNKDLQDILVSETTFLPENATLSERLYNWLNGLTEISKCPYCGKPLKYKGKIDKGYFATCGDGECKKKGMRKGANNKPSEVLKAAVLKGQETYFKKTGYRNVWQNPEGRAKWEQNYIEKHGVNHPMKRKEIIEKANASKIERFGTTNILQLDSTIKHIIEKYGSLENFYKECGKKRRGKILQCRVEQLESRIKELDMTLLSTENDILKLKCNKCNKEFTITRQGLNIYYRENKRFCPKCDYKNMKFRSNKENEVYEFIANNCDYEVKHNKHIGKYEVDILIEDLKLCIDFNGLYWHSELYKEKDYHIKKKEEIESKGYKLVYIWEDDWTNENKQEIIKSRLLLKIGKAKNIIYARKSKIVEYTRGTKKHEIEFFKNTVRKFLEENHLQGFVGASKYYGLEYNGELVELITFGKTRKMISGNTDSIELLRLCTKKNTCVVGGFSKLLKHAIKENNYKVIWSYVDLDWTSLKESSYQSIGFDKIKVTAPDYYWVISNSRENRLNYAKNLLVKRGEDKNMTEIEIMHSHNHYRIFGTGNLLMKYKCKG